MAFPVLSRGGGTHEFLKNGQPGVRISCPSEVIQASFTGEDSFHETHCGPPCEKNSDFCDAFLLTRLIFSVIHVLKNWYTQSAARPKNE